MDYISSLVTLVTHKEKERQKVLSNRELEAFVHACLDVGKKILAEMERQSVALESIATSLQSNEATSLVLTLGQPQAQ